MRCVLGLLTLLAVIGCTDNEITTTDACQV